MNTTVNTAVNAAVNNLTNVINNVCRQQPIDLTQVINAIKCYCGEQNVTYRTQSIVSNSTGGVFQLPSGTVACIISGNPGASLRVPRQAGGGNSPDVYFWGHCAIAYGNSNGGTRTKLQFASQSIEVDNQPAKILISPYYELTASVIAVVKELNCNV